MDNKKIKKTGEFVLECAKWGLVIYLLWPLHRAMSEPVNFTRIVFGILLFVLFSGKLFYDSILRKWRQQKQRSMAADLLSTLAMVVALSMVIGLVVLSIGMLVFSMMQDATKQQ
ncbi:hypothetical protein JXO59_13525 [candidate division KSB1 bacterium]|nr:hypothetical protein [candidate division KSB1 bacterium]